MPCVRIKNATFFQLTQGLNLMNMLQEEIIEQTSKTGRHFVVAGILPLYFGSFDNARTWAESIGLKLSLEERWVTLPDGKSKKTVSAVFLGKPQMPESVSPTKSPDH